MACYSQRGTRKRSSAGPDVTTQAGQTGSHASVSDTRFLQVAFRVSLRTRRRSLSIASRVQPSARRYHSDAAEVGGEPADDGTRRERPIRHQLTPKAVDFAPLPRRLHDIVERD